MTIAEELRSLAKQPVYHALDIKELQQKLWLLADQVEQREKVHATAKTIYRQLGEVLHP